MVAAEPLEPHEPVCWRPVPKYNWLAVLVAPVSAALADPLIVKFPAIAAVAANVLLPEPDNVKLLNI